MSHTVDLVSGWTGRLDFQLLTDGTPVSLSTADKVSPFLVDKNGAETAVSSSDITVITASSGAVGYNPASTNVFSAGVQPYTLRFKVVDVNSKIVYYPNADPMTIGVKSA